MTSMPLMTKATLLIVVLMAVTIVCLGSVALWRVNALLDASVAMRLNGVADARAAQINGIVENDFGRTALIASRTRLRQNLQVVISDGPDAEANRRQMVEILEDAQHSAPGLTLVEVSDARGIVVVATAPGRQGTLLEPAPPSVTPGDVSYFRLGEWHERDGVPAYAVDAPLFSPDRQNPVAIGWVRATYHASRILDICAQRGGLGETGEFVLSALEGGSVRVLEQSGRNMDNGPRRFPVQSSQAEILKAPFEQRRGLQRQVTDHQRTVVHAAYRYLPAADWGLIVKVDAAETFIGIRDLVRQLAATRGGLLALGLLCSLVFAMPLSRSLHKLRLGAETIAAGDVEARVDVANSNETGLLAESVNQMAAQLAGSAAVRSELAKEMAARRQAATECAQASQDLKHFTHVVAHDLHDAIREIRDGGDWLAGGSQGESDGDDSQYFAQIRKAAQDLEDLVANLLAFYRVATEGRPVAPTDLNAVVSEVLAELAGTIETTGAAIQVESLPVLEVDPEQIRQVFHHLISNALAFNRPDVPPQVTISAQRLEPFRVSSGGEEEFWEIQVRDNGIGFDTQQAEEMFGTFQQLRDQGSIKGRGMGLAICRRIAERHGGIIRAEGARGEGATLPTRPSTTSLMMMARPV